MADIAVSVTMGVMKPLLAKLTTLMGGEYKNFKNIREEVTFLQRELSDMEALLEKMDNADELDPQAKNWREDIIDMSYNIENCIDDFMCRIGEADDKMGILRKASGYLRSFKDRRRLANQFHEIKARLMEASERRKRYMFDQCISISTPVFVDPRLSALYKESSSLVGINTQKDKLVRWAIDEGQQLKVISIVGLGGLGKTTLANEVYREVGAQFNCKAFVSVSQKPEIMGLFNSLLSQLGLGPCSHACQVQDPINKLRGHLEDKRYFIIVDDLWDTQAWDAIRCALPQNNQCSRVMITTRNENVARSCCGNRELIYNMKPLAEEDSKKLFFDRIFGSEDGCPSELMKASCEILKKCGGLPLAIITMASMLACEPLRLECNLEYIQNSLATMFVTNINYENMMCILDLSYKNLPRHLKACFLYLGSYPEDHAIRRVDLVRRWVAEGFVSNSTGLDVWDVAESYFNELVNRNLIQPIYQRYTIGVPACRVHDMLLELIARKCKEDNFLSLVNDPEAVVDAQHKVIRRLNVIDLRGTKDGDGKVAINIARNLSQLRSLTIFGGSNLILPPLLRFKFMRVLLLEISYGREMAMDVTGISQLSLLRYLKAGGKVALPGRIQGLRLLETLDLSGISSGSIPPEIVDVGCLSHLAMLRGTRLPDGIGEVKSLRTLHGFSLPMDSLKSITALGELTNLSDLLLYFPECVPPLTKATWMAALSTSLQKLINLKQLTIQPSESGNAVALCAGALNSLSPSFWNLEVLSLQDTWTFTRVPRWITHLHNLRQLWLGVRHIVLEDVAIVGTRLSSLVDLRLRILSVPTERIVIGHSTGFPVVKWFEFNCDGISYLTFEAGAMPELRELELAFDADEWDKAAPAGLQHLPRLEKITALKACYQTGQWWTRGCSSKEEAALIRGVFQRAVDALPTRPEFTFAGDALRIRPVEEEDYYLKTEGTPQ